jgi:ethanolamine utilization protein EutN
VLLGVVVGEVWATRKSAPLLGEKLLVVQPRCAYGALPGGDHLVAVDKLGAGVGEEVIVCFGSPPRAEHGGTHVPVEAAVMAIVDRTRLTHDDPRLPFCFTAQARSPRALEKP